MNYPGFLYFHCFLFDKGGYDHSNTEKIPHGIILVKGPNIKKNYEIKDAHIYDILPILLYSMNLPIGKDMDGKVLKEIFTNKFLKKRKIRYVESYETLNSKNATNSKNKIDKLNKKYLEELRTLGYIK